MYYTQDRCGQLRPKEGQQEARKKSKVNGKHRITVTGSKKCAKVMTQ